MTARTIDLSEPPPGSTSWADAFANYSGLHFVTLGILVGAILISIAHGKRRLGSPGERRLSLCWGLWILVSMAAAQMYFCLPRYFRPEWSLPLHVCDLVAVLSGIAILFPWRWPQTICVFWGLALCTQAFITPTVRVGFGHVHFWYFWLSHTYAIGTALYLVAVRLYRPTWRDYAVSCITMACYISLIFPADVAFRWNYGFVGDSAPDKPTIIDKLGPWPVRVYFLGAIAFAVMALVWGLVLLFHAWHDRRARRLPTQ